MLLIIKLALCCHTSATHRRLQKSLLDRVQGLRWILDEKGTEVDHVYLERHRLEKLMDTAWKDVCRKVLVRDE